MANDENNDSLSSDSPQQPNTETNPQPTQLPTPTILAVSGNDITVPPTIPPQFETGSGETTRNSDTQIPSDRDMAGRSANRMALGANVINAILAIFTILLFIKTQDSVDIANRALKNSEIKDIQDSINREKTYFIDSVNTAKRFKSDSASFQAQIDVFNETKKHFELENRPFVSLNDIEVDSNFDDNIIIVDVLIGNVGKFPAKIISLKSHIAIGTDMRKEPVLKSEITTTLFNQYVVNNVTINYLGNIDNVPEYLQNLIKSGEISILFYGDLLYEAANTKKKYEKHFVYQITFKEILSVTALVNDEN